MTTQEAKFILSAYRPNGSDASGPAFAEALQAAVGDPALGAWFSVSRGPPDGGRRRESRGRSRRQRACGEAILAGGTREARPPARASARASRGRRGSPPRRAWPSSSSP